MSFSVISDMSTLNSFIIFPLISLSLIALSSVTVPLYLRSGLNETTGIEMDWANPGSSLYKDNIFSRNNSSHILSQSSCDILSSFQKSSKMFLSHKRLSTSSLRFGIIGVSLELYPESSFWLSCLSIL